MRMRGMAMRSAKMNEITPPKLIPPDHSAAASGTFPMEQNQLRMAMISHEPKMPLPTELENHFILQIGRPLDLECGDTSPLSHDATCRVVSKRGHVHALQIRALPSVQAI